MLLLPSSFDYRDENIYTFGSLSTFDPFADISSVQYLSSSASQKPLAIASINWTKAFSLLSQVEITSLGVESSIFSTDFSQREYENFCYGKLFISLRSFSSCNQSNLTSNILDYQHYCLPLQEFGYYLSRWHCFNAIAKADPYLTMIAFYSAVVLGDVSLSQKLEAGARIFINSLTSDVISYSMFRNIYCLYLLRTGCDLRDVLSVNQSILDKLRDLSPESSAILLLNRARIFARLGDFSSAITFLCKSFELRQSLAPLPSALKLLYLLYYFRWSYTPFFLLSFLTDFSTPGLTPLSWRFNSFFPGLPSSRLFILNCRINYPESFLTQLPLCDLAQSIFY